MKYLLLFLISLSAYGDGQITVDRWTPLSNAQAWACPASELLVVNIDVCKLQGDYCVPVDLAPCQHLVLTGDEGNPSAPIPVPPSYRMVIDYTLAADANSKITTSNDYKKIPITDDWGVDGHVLSTSGSKAQWEKPDYVPSGALIIFPILTPCPTGYTDDGNAVFPTYGQVNVCKKD